MFKQSYSIAAASMAHFEYSTPCDTLLFEHYACLESLMQNTLETPEYLQNLI